MTLTPQETFELKVLFLRALAENYRRARTAHERLLHSPADHAAAEQLRDFFHRIAGTAHAVNFNVLGYTAAICERIAGSLAKGQGSDASESLHAVGDGLAAVATLLEECGNGQSE